MRVLGIDNIAFISILVDKLPEERQALARRLGLGMALAMRILPLLTSSWVIALTAPRNQAIAMGESRIPRERVDAEREAIKDNQRQSSNGDRFWLEQTLPTAEAAAYR